MAHLYLSAAHKSSGKTTLSLGLCAAFRGRGLRVQAYKKGPDYIDPMWLQQASGQPCYNLDFNTMTADEIRAKVARHLVTADIGIIEGNKGLYDGMALDLSNSNAAVARLVGAPVVLVIDAQGMTRGIAPLLLGYQQFDPEVQLAGVILNRVAGQRHETKLRETVEHYTDIPVLGAVHRNPELAIEERHLGLVPSNEDSAAHDRIQRVAALIRDQVNLDAVHAVAARAEPLPATAATASRPQDQTPGAIRIGIARDAAFGFYYPDDLEALELAGAEIVPVNLLRDSRLPQIDGLFIGGGFPETSMAALSANRGMRESVRRAIENGLPTYAECGGLMYLTRSLRWGDQCCEMVGIIPADTIMHDRPQGRGYMELEETPDAPWPLPVTGRPIAAHEFHYSRLENMETDELRFAYRVRRGAGIDGQRDGIVYRNLLACYAHLRDTAQFRWAARFVRFIREQKTAQSS